MPDVIELERLTKSYGDRRGVVELGFSVSQGEVFGYLGPNGAGKTTTIRTMLDFIRPTSGSARIFGLDSHANALEIHRRVGYLPGEFGMYDRMTGGEYLRFYAALRGEVDDAAILAVAERLQLDLRDPIKELSHGNKQKIGLVQAFMHRPELLILDEPTQGLDPIVQQEFHAMLAEARQDGRTVFLSSHVMPEVERLCDRVGIIREGRLVTIEDIGDLRAKEFRMLEIHLAQHADPSAFTGIAGVDRVESEGDTVRLRMLGAMDPLIKTLARFDVVDVVSHEPSLEDIFLEHYGGDGGTSDGG
jgi:beta-exotoxin I transport system ATP-binding protein